MPRRDDEYAYEQTYDDDEEANDESNEGMCIPVCGFRPVR